MSLVSQQLDLVPANGEPDGKSRDLLVPLHADKWALALAEGFLGGDLKDDRACDLQSGRGCDLIGFVGYIPSWAMAEGEGGCRVVLHIDCDSQSSVEGDIITLKGPLRVTAVKKASFLDRDALINFNASWHLLPDVPVGLVPLSVGDFEVREEVRCSKLEPGSDNGLARRQELDFLGGWAIGVLAGLREGTQDEPIMNFLEQVSQNQVPIAKASLLALDPSASSLDVAIWSSAVDGLRRRFGERGFDRQQFLEGITEEIASFGKEADSWSNGCRRVVKGEIDMPCLDDSANVGRRAALALILANSPEALPELSRSWAAGPKVTYLVTQAVHAFQGLSRADASSKQPVGQMNGLLAVAEGLEGGCPVKVEIFNVGLNSEFVRTVHVCINGEKQFERLIPPPPHLQILMARARQAGHKIEIDPDRERLLIQPMAAAGPSIIVQESNSRGVGQAVTELVLPLARLGPKPTVASLKAFLDLAWRHSTTIGSFKDGSEERVFAVVKLLLRTLDQDEYEFHIRNIVGLWSETNNQKPNRRGRASS